MHQSPHVLRCTRNIYLSFHSEVPNIQQIVFDNNSQTTATTETWITIIIPGPEVRASKQSAIKHDSRRGSAGDATIYHANFLHCSTITGASPLPSVNHPWLNLSLGEAPVAWSVWVVRGAIVQSRVSVTHRWSQRLT